MQAPFQLQAQSRLERYSLWLALGTLLLWFVLLWFNPYLPTLTGWQRNGSYKASTGYLLVALFTMLLLTPLLRRWTNRIIPVGTWKLLHQFGGCLLLALLCLHAGFHSVGFLTGLLVCVLAAIVLALLYGLLKLNQVWKRSLLSLHIGSSIVAAGLALLHIYYASIYTG